MQTATEAIAVEVLNEDLIDIVSKADAKERGFKRQITEEDDPDIMFASEYGWVSFLVWLECEWQRLRFANIDSVIVKNGGGRMALYAR